MSNSLGAFPLRKRKPLRISTDIPLFVRCSSDSSSSSSSPTNQNDTPGTTPSTDTPHCFIHVLCMHDFDSSEPVQLPFRKGEVLTIIKQEPSGWWAAMRPQGDRIGWIPSSFVLPVDGSRIVESPDEAWPYENINHPPLSAVHDHWVPVSEDPTALSFRLVTPTDLVPLKGLDDRLRSHDHESPLSTSQFPDMEDLYVPPTPQSLPIHTVQTSHPSNRLPSESERIDSKSLPCLTTPVSSDDIALRLTSTLDIEDSLVVAKSISTSTSTCSGDGIDGQSQRFRFPANFCRADPVQGISKIKSLDLSIWRPDSLAEQLYVLMHTLYAAVHQNDCLDWMMGRGNTHTNGLRPFFHTHDDIASWVQKLILVSDGDIARRTEPLDFWIRVAERCRALRSFDSLCGIILGLSGSSISISSPGSAWARCAHKETFVTLRNMLDVSNKFDDLMDLVDAAMGQAVLYVRGYLDHIKTHRTEHSNTSTPSHQSGLPAVTGLSVALCRAAVSTLLRHQSSSYDFKITEPIPSFIDDQLQNVRLSNDWPLAGN